MNVISDVSNALFEHSAVIDNLTFQIRSRLSDSICRVYSDHIKYLMCDEIVEPDVSIVCGKINNDRTIVRNTPKVVIEVLSPSTVKRDRTEEMKLYCMANVSEYWLVDWVERKIEIYLFDGELGDADGYLVRTIDESNKNKLSFITLPIQLDFDTLFDFNTLC